jgi:hypothetical protein
MRRWAIGLLMGCLVLGACGRTDRDLESEGEAAQISEFARTTPMADLSLNGALFQVESLGFLPGVETRANPIVWPIRGIPDGDRHLSLQLVSSSGSYAGWVSMFLFESRVDREQAFAMVGENVRGYEQVGVMTVGEDSIAYDEDGMHGIAFECCRALVNVFAPRSVSMARLVEYASGLAARLPYPICD